MSSTPFLRSSFDEHASRLYPGHQPASQEMIKQMLYAMGTTDDTLLEHLDRLNKQWDDIFAQVPNGRLPTIGEKPKPGDKDVWYYTIPKSHLAIRIWNGGLKDFGGYWLDFFDIGKRVAVNTPVGYEISHVPYPECPDHTEQIYSLEESFDPGAEIPDGEEKYGVHEGWQMVLVRPNTDQYCFEVPFRVPSVRSQATLLGQ